MEAKLQYVCAKCGYVPKDRLDATKHILMSHAEMSNYFAAVPIDKLEVPTKKPKPKKPEPEIEGDLSLED